MKYRVVERTHTYGDGRKCITYVAQRRLLWVFWTDMYLDTFGHEASRLNEFLTLRAATDFISKSKGFPMRYRGKRIDVICDPPGTVVYSVRFRNISIEKSDLGELKEYIDTQIVSHKDRVVR